MRWLLAVPFLLTSSGSGGCGHTIGSSTTSASPTPPAAPSSTLAAGSASTPLTTPVGDAIKIDAPPTDTLLVTGNVDLRGSAGGAGTSVSITVGGHTQAAPVSGGTWLAPVTLPPGLNEVTARQGQASDSILLTLGTGLLHRSRQRVRFLWVEGVDTELRAIARGTLQSPTTANVEAFVVGVRQLTPAVVFRAYEGVDVVETDADGPDVHTIRLLPTNGTIFGQSPYDCGNQRPQQSSEIWVGSYRAEMVDSLDLWRPMSRSDSLQTRIQDVAEALGRTSAHEMGHSLGFVGSELGQPCGWMRGCDEGHNCSALSEQFPNISNRFAFGRFIMDPGGKTSNHARIAELFTQSRATVRTPAVFNPFNRSYLAVVHPAP